MRNWRSSVLQEMLRREQMQARTKKVQSLEALTELGRSGQTERSGE